MLHIPVLIHDLAVLLIIAACVTLIFKLIKQPIVLGYIIAGFLAGPNFDLTPTITDSETIKIWAEIGVIFLLFGLGLEFSFKKLKAVGGPASITGIIELTTMLSIGYVTGKLLGWNDIDSIFLGGIISISSTTIIIRAFEELGVKNQHFASLVFGILIVEDLVAILLLVLLSTIAVTQQFEGSQLVFSSLKLGFFLLLWFISGIFVIPTVINRFKKHLSDELLLILSLGLCLAMVIIAANVGFSPALGAFIMGSILAETSENKRIEHLIQPIKDFFGAIFFVSVGILIDPKIILEHWQSALIIISVVIFGKIISVSIGSLVSGQTLKNSVRTGFSLAQIGEFSFIIATLGVTLNVTSEFLYPLAVAVSVFTTFTTPYCVKYSSRFAIVLEKSIPKKLKILLQRYSSSTQVISVSNEAKTVFKAYLIKLSLITFVLIALTITSHEFALKRLYLYISNEKLASSLTFIGTFLGCTPFFWALTKGKMTSHFIALNNPRLNTMRLILQIVGYGIVGSVVSLQIFMFLPNFIEILFIFGLSILGLVVFSNHLGLAYEWVEKTFIKNLYSKAKTELVLTTLLPWEAHLATYEIAPEVIFVGKTLEELAIRDKYGVSVVLIERGKRKIKAPSKDEVLFPNDKVSVIGTDDQLAQFKQFLDTGKSNIDESKISNYGLKGCVLEDASPFVGKSIRDSGIRELTEGLVVGLEREGERIINPDSRMPLKKDDILWIVGNKDLLKKLS